MRRSSRTCAAILPTATRPRRGARCVGRRARAGPPRSSALDSESVTMVRTLSADKADRTILLQGGSGPTAGHEPRRTARAPGGVARRLRRQHHHRGFSLSLEAHPSENDRSPVRLSRSFSDGLERLLSYRFHGDVRERHSRAGGARVVPTPRAQQYSSTAAQQPEKPTHNTQAACGRPHFSFVRAPPPSCVLMALIFRAPWGSGK